MLSDHVRAIAALMIMSSPLALGHQTRELDPQWQAPVVAMVDGQAITQSDLDDRLGDKLLKLRTDEYNLVRATLEEYTDEILIAHEAAKRGLSVSELLKKELTDKVSATTEAEAQILVLGFPMMYQSMPEKQALEKAKEDLRARRTAKRRSDLVTSLRAQYRHTILVEAPRAAHDFQAGQTEGPADAPVRVVEFSDFQCPFCTQLSVTLAQLHRDYPTQVQITFKNFPLPIHSQASKAAESAACAAQQKRFWPMHDLLFAEKKLVSNGDFEELAQRAGLDLAAFEHCLNSHETLKTVVEDTKQGTRAGVGSTPTMFINGQMISGNKSYEALREILNEELQRAKMQRHPSSASIAELETAK